MLVAALGSDVESSKSAVEVNMDKFLSAVPRRMGKPEEVKVLSTSHVWPLLVVSSLCEHLFAEQYGGDCIVVDCPIVCCCAVQSMKRGNLVCICTLSKYVSTHEQLCYQYGHVQEMMPFDKQYHSPSPSLRFSCASFSLPAHSNLNTRN